MAYSRDFARRQFGGPRPNTALSVCRRSMHMPQSLEKAVWTQLNGRQNRHSPRRASDGYINVATIGGKIWERCAQAIGAEAARRRGRRWRTSEMFTKAGYEVVGLDIASDMIDLAKQRDCGATFMVSDYEVGPIANKYDAAVIYDALHHADNERLVIKNVFDALTDDGIFITVEPGSRAFETADSLQAMEKTGATEKDMPFSHQRDLMEDVGFARSHRETYFTTPATQCPPN
ncbi:SAM-dependent methyltransferase [Nitrobacteraceae bacterium AZCC 2161]